MGKKHRLDAELVKRGLAKSRQEAHDLIASGNVEVAGVKAMKSATQIVDNVSIVIKESQEKRWASRGAYKLLGAIEYFSPAGLALQGKTVLDAGASHGGFTDVLLDQGVGRVFAVDVGYGQLAWHLQSHPQVKIYDRTNIRYCSAIDFPCPIDMIVSDLSFISLEKVLPAFIACLRPGGQMLPMVKPQFELGKGLVGKNGVVKDPILRLQAVARIACIAKILGMTVLGAIASPLPGPSGNVEYFLWLEYPYSDTRLLESKLYYDRGEDSEIGMELVPEECLTSQEYNMLRYAVETGPR